MTPVAYVALIRQDGPDAYLVTFPDVPEAISQGASREEAAANAADALEAALEGYLELGRDFPEPARPLLYAPSREEAVDVAVPPALAARALLARELKTRKLTKVALGELMGRDEKVVRRILSGQGATLDLTLEALQAVGLRPALAV